MNTNENKSIKARIDRIRHLTGDNQGSDQFFEAAVLAQSVLYDTVSGGHPLMATLKSALDASNWQRAAAASRGVVTLFDEGALKNPRLVIAREIEGDLLDIAQSQVQAAEMSKDDGEKHLQLSIAAFLAGAALEDALRRLCDSNTLSYDTQKSSISKLQSALFQPSKQIEVISNSENKQITVWGDTRNKADHGRFGEITHTETIAMILGVRAFIERHFPE
jgi:hypothetical protein